MKNRIITTTFIVAILVGSCKQEVIKLEPLKQVTPDPGPTPSKGSADFTKFVAIGNSLTSGYQAGALFNDGQQNSLGALLAKQFATVGGGTFNQPDINSQNGFNTTTTNPPFTGGPVLGRLILFDPDGSGPRSAAPRAIGTPAENRTCPSPLQTPAVPGTGESPTPFSGTKSALNNFGVPGIQLAQALTPLTGGPPTSNPAFNPFYARFASNPGTSTILGDAIAANGTFFMFFLGNNDVLGYATTGGVGTIPLTSVSSFTTAYNAAIAQLLAANPNSKGVIGNIPDVTTIPFFFTVPFNAISLVKNETVDQAAQLNAAFAGYNAVLDAIKANPTLLALSTSTAANLDARKISYTAGAGNRILIAEKTSDFPDLGATFDALQSAGGITSQQRAALEPYRRVRQTTSTDLITLSAGSVLGTCVGGNPSAIIGTTIPLADQFVLIPSETQAILSATAQFNAIIKLAADNSNNRIAFADVNTVFKKLVADRVQLIDGVLISPTITPPTAGFSEDGVHPNNRGYGYLANIFIDAINSKFGSTIPKVNLSTLSVRPVTTAP